ncbi:MAG: hypothetical protein ACLQCU_09090, partial [Acidimicrobiales bacterium]
DYEPCSNQLTRLAPSTMRPWIAPRWGGGAGIATIGQIQVAAPWGKPPTSMTPMSRAPQVKRA